MQYRGKQFGQYVGRTWPWFLVPPNSSLILHQVWSLASSIHIIWSLLEMPNLRPHLKNQKLYFTKICKRLIGTFPSEKSYLNYNSQPRHICLFIQ